MIKDVIRLFNWLSEVQVSSYLAYSVCVGTTTVMLPLLTMHMLYDVRCGTVV